MCFNVYLFEYKYEKIKHPKIRCGITSENANRRNGASVTPWMASVKQQQQTSWVYIIYLVMIYILILIRFFLYFQGATYRANIWNGAHGPKWWLFADDFGIFGPRRSRYNGGNVCQRLQTLTAICVKTYHQSTLKLKTRRKTKRAPKSFEQIFKAFGQAATKITLTATAHESHTKLGRSGAPNDCKALQKHR